jgi:glutaredoxin-like protein
MSNGEQAILVYGAMWCPDTVRSRNFLDKNGIAYQWFDIDHNPEAKEFVRKTNNGQVVVPTIIFPDGTILVEPSDEELGGKVRS